MRKAIAIVGAVVLSLAAGAALAQGSADKAAAASTHHDHSVCLWSRMIDHTKVVDTRTILFYMRNGKIWKNTLQSACPDLKYFGYVMVQRDSQICSNMQPITVIQTHEPCMLGTFEPYTPPPKGKDDGKT